MTDQVFFDTNILVYAYDTHEPSRQEIAKDLILKNIRSRSGYVSIQVFGEFYNVITRKIPEPLSSEDARDAISYLSILNIIEMDIDLVHRSIDTHQEYGITYWDSMIIAAAERANCTKVLSEDFNTSQLYHGIIAENPFL